MADDDAVPTVVYPTAPIDDDDFEEETPIRRTHSVRQPAAPTPRSMTLGQRLDEERRTMEAVEEGYALLKMTNTFETHTFLRQSICNEIATYAKPGSRWTFLHQALWWNNTVATVALLEWGANWSASTTEGQTAADIGVSRNSNAALQVLTAFIARNSTPTQSPHPLRMPPTPVKGPSRVHLVGDE
jgi:hypothetical protein